LKKETGLALRSWSEALKDYLTTYRLESVGKEIGGQEEIGHEHLYHRDGLCWVGDRSLLAEFGMNLICVDIDRPKIELLQKGKVTIHEPGLRTSCEKYEEGRLSFRRISRRP